MAKGKIDVKGRRVMVYGAVPAEMSSGKDRGIGAWEIGTKAKSEDVGLPFETEEEG